LPDGFALPWNLDELPTSYTGILALGSPSPVCGDGGLAVPEERDQKGDQSSGNLVPQPARSKLAGQRRRETVLPRCSPPTVAMAVW
jgi:hypothetical protein